MLDTILVMQDANAAAFDTQLLSFLALPVSTISNRSDLLEKVTTMPPRLVVLNLGRPVATRELCREIRRRSLSVPILVLMEQGDRVDRASILEAGADDCVQSPCNSRELLARFRVLLRRAVPAPQRKPHEVFRFDEIQVNFDTMELSREGRPVPLTRQEFKMLKFFISNQHRVVSRNELLNEVWGYTCYPTTRTVDTHVFRLRRKLEKDPLEPTYFRTVHGTGYKFVAQ